MSTEAQWTGKSPARARISPERVRSNEKRPVKHRVDSDEFRPKREEHTRGDRPNNTGELDQVQGE